MADTATAKTAPDRAKAVAALDSGACPSCTVGVLRVVGYDPENTHEQQQGHTTIPFESAPGGAVHLHCFLCNHHESRGIDAPEDEA